MPSTSSPADRPAPTLRAAAWVVAAEGVALLAVGVGYVGYYLAGHRPADAAILWWVVAFALAAGAGLALVGRSLARRGRWARSPAVLAQIFCLPVTWSLLTSGHVIGGIALGVVAVGALILLLAPATGAELDR